MKAPDLTWFDYTLIALAIFLLFQFPNGWRMAEDANQWHSIQGTVR